jgi:hypothetical protein
MSCNLYPMITAEEKYISNILHSHRTFLVSQKEQFNGHDQGSTARDYG